MSDLLTQALAKHVPFDERTQDIRRYQHALRQRERARAHANIDNIVDLGREPQIVYRERRIRYTRHSVSEWKVDLAAALIGGGVGCIITALAVALS